MDNSCCIKGCEKPILAMGMCVNHWRMNKKHGSPVAARGLAAENNGLTHEQRFWKSVKKSDDPNGCWIWQASGDKDGYGVFHAVIAGVKTGKAHRYSHMLHTGEVIGKHQLVMHSCDNPPCVNPAHLNAGTPMQNMHDMIRKGRDSGFRKIHAKWMQKLTDDQVRSILRDPRRYPVIAREYGIHAQSVLAIKARSTRAEVAIDPAEIVRSSRGARGTERSKNLTEDDVRAIRASEIGPTALSKFYKVTPATICDIRFRRSWTHIN